MVQESLEKNSSFAHETLSVISNGGKPREDDNRLSVVSNLRQIKDIINPYNCFLKNTNFSIKTSNG